MSITDTTNITCFCLLIALSFVMALVCKRIWKEKWLPCLIWIVCVDLVGLFLLIHRLML